MTDIIELAEKLGQAIAQSPQADKLRSAKRELNADTELTKLLSDYRSQAQKTADLERDKKPIEPQDKHHLADLQQRLVSNEKFKRLTAAQVDYVDLMRKVNGVLRKHLMEVEGQSDQTSDSEPS